MRKVLANGESGADHRSKVNDMFQEIYQDLISGLSFRGILTGSDSVASPAPAMGYYFIVGEAKAAAGTIYGQTDVTGGVAVGDMLIYNGSAWEQYVGFWLRGITETISRSTGTPATGDPLTTAIVSHTLSATYTVTPTVVIVSKCDINLYLVSVSTTTVVVGVGGVGSATSIDYELLVYSNG